jgi:hypothetical protein
MKFWAFKVDLHMKSGAAIGGYVTHMTKNIKGNDLVRLTWEGDMPFYFRMDDVSAITYTRVVNWRKMFRG